MTDEAELVKSAQTRDAKGEAAFAKLYDRYLPRLVALAAGIVGKNDADEVANAAMMQAFLKLSSYTGKGSFEGWLKQIARNHALDEMRRRKRRPTERARSLESLEQGHDQDDTMLAEEYLEQRTDREAGIVLMGEPAIATVEVEPPVKIADPDEHTIVPTDQPGIAAIMYFAALAWPDTDARSHEQRDRVMIALAHLAARRGRELGFQPTTNLTMSPQQQSGALKLARKRLQKRLEAASALMLVLGAFRQPDFKPWTLGAVAARSKPSRTSWYRDAWTATLPVMHLAWKFRGVFVRRRYTQLDDATLLDLLLEPSWVTGAVEGAEKLVPILPKTTLRGDSAPMLELPALVRLHPDH